MSSHDDVTTRPSLPQPAIRLRIVTLPFGSYDHLTQQGAGRPSRWPIWWCRPVLREDFSLQQLKSVHSGLRSSRHSGDRPLQLLRVSMNHTSPLLVLILAILPATLSHAGTPAPALATSAYVPAVADTTGSSAALWQQARILRARPELLQEMLPIWRSQDPMSTTHVSPGLELMQAAKN